MLLQTKNFVISWDSGCFKNELLPLYQKGNYTILFTWLGLAILYERD
jgi:hypothetical protein